MKSRTARRKGPVGRATGYGGAVLLTLAAAAVLILPLLDGGEPAAGTSPAAGAGTSGPPSRPAQPLTPTARADNPDPQATGQGRYPQGQNQGTEQGGGPPMPGERGGGTLTWCPAGTASYRAETGGKLLVKVNVSGSGVVRAEVALRGRSPRSQQDTVAGGRPHTFTFTKVNPALVERVKITTISVGLSSQTCYAKPGQ